MEVKGMWLAAHILGASQADTLRQIGDYIQQSAHHKNAVASSWLFSYFINVVDNKVA